MGDVDGDGIYDLVAGAGKDYAPEVVAYSGKGGTFTTELARFKAFADTAQGGVSVTVSSVDGSTSDNIIVGSPPGIPSEVKVFRTDCRRPAKLPSSSRASIPIQRSVGRDRQPRASSTSLPAATASSRLQGPAVRHR